VFNDNLNDIYPPYFKNIKPKSKRKSAKRELRKIAKGYCFDENHSRLIKILNISNNKNKPKIKKYFIAYELEKINIIKRFHELSSHRGYKTLYILK